MTNVIDEDIAEAQKVSAEIYDDLIEHLNKKYPKLDIGILSFNLWADLGEQLITHNDWTVRELTRHLSVANTKAKENRG